MRVTELKLNSFDGEKRVWGTTILSHSDFLRSIRILQSYLNCMFIFGISFSYIHYIYNIDIYYNCALLDIYARNSANPLTLTTSVSIWRREKNKSKKLWLFPIWLYFFQFFVLEFQIRAKNWRCRNEEKMHSSMELRWLEKLTVFLCMMASCEIEHRMRIASMMWVTEQNNVIINRQFV